MNIPYDIIISSNDNATSFVQLNEQYNTLYNLLVNNQRQISYLDLYKITEYINTSEEEAQIGSKFAQLSPNTAIGIGIPSIHFNGETFYQGDLLLKLSNGQMQKLDAPSHGIYFPRWESEGNIGKKLVWEYSIDEPIIPNNETELEPVAMSAKNKAESLLYWDIPNVSSPNGYGQKILRVGEGNTWETNITAVGNLVPIIKCFNQDNEEILTEITVELLEGNTGYKISNIPSCISYLMIR